MVTHGRKRALGYFGMITPYKVKDGSSPQYAVTIGKRMRGKTTVIKSEGSQCMVYAI